MNSSDKNEYFDVLLRMEIELMQAKDAIIFDTNKKHADARIKSLTKLANTILAKTETCEDTRA